MAANNNDGSSSKEAGVEDLANMEAPLLNLTEASQSKLSSEQPKMKDQDAGSRDSQAVLQQDALQSELIDTDPERADDKGSRESKMASEPISEQVTSQKSPEVEHINQLGAQLSLLDEPITETVTFPISPIPRGPEQSYISQDTGLSDSQPAPLVSPAKKPLKIQETDKADSEIQSIMEQFDDEEDELQDEPTSERSGLPPRTSSLEKVHSTPSVRSVANGSNVDLPGVASRASSIRSLSFSKTGRYSLAEGNQPMSPLKSPSIHKALPPAPDPDLPFDFHRFLDQLRHRTADPVAKFLRSFLFEFGKKQWMVHEQIKIIGDFLIFITGKMSQCEVWREVSDAEFDNAREGMEKLVMNRLYSQTYSPAIPAPLTSPKGKKKATDRSAGPVRRGQHQEDIERDDILAQKIRIYGWVRPEHLDIPKVEDGNKRFFKLAQQEILKISSYRAPRDKVICILNCCKVIFGLLKNLKSADTSADAFIPMLIYVTLQANPEHLVSNVQYILRFRNPDKLGGEAGYYVSSLMGAIQFIENLDRTSLTITDEDFEKNVELAVSAIAEKPAEFIPQDTPRQAEFNEKLDRDRLVSRTSTGLSEPRTPTRESMEKGNESLDEKAAIGNILKSFQRPLTNIGRMFSDEGTSSQYPANQQQRSGPPVTPRGVSPAAGRASIDNTNGISEKPLPLSKSPKKVSAEDAAARQASAEAAEAQRITKAEHKDVVDTLCGMFPDLDRDVIDDVVRMKEGRIGAAVDACLALNNAA